MKMTHTLQGQITTLTSQVNEHVCQAASKTVYNTVDETYISTTLASTLNEEEPVSEMTENTERDIRGELPVSLTSKPGKYLNSNVVQRLSTPKMSKQKDADRLRPVPRNNQQHNPRSPPKLKPRSSLQDRNISKDILLMGDSLISSINHPS